MGRLAKVDSFLTYSILDLVHFSQKRNHVNENDSKSDENHRDVAEKRLSQKNESRVVVVAQLVERSLPIPEVRGSNPVIGKNLY